MFDNYLFPPGKRKYIDKKRKGELNERCILCAVRDGEDWVEKLTVYESENFIVSVNLYPYNPGHIMIFPKRHMEHIYDMTDEENAEMFKLQKKCMRVLDKIYAPGGYNIGFNIGKAAGASIKHIHLHIVPRFENELGFVDILAGAKILVEFPDEILEKLKKEFEEESDV